MKQRISVKIAGKEAVLNVEAEREEVIRRAVDHINKEIASLRFDFRDQELADVLALVLLSEETRLMEMEARLKSENDTLLSRLEELDSDLEEYLSRQSRSMPKSTF